MGMVKDFIVSAWNLYCDGYSKSEIAERYGCSEDDVRWALKTFCEFKMEGDR